MRNFLQTHKYRLIFLIFCFSCFGCGYHSPMHIPISVFRICKQFLWHVYFSHMSVPRYMCISSQFQICFSNCVDSNHILTTCKLFEIQYVLLVCLRRQFYFLLCIIYIIKGISNRWQLNCLVDSFTRPTTKKTQVLHYCPFVRGTTVDWWIPLTKGQ